MWESALLAATIRGARRLSGQLGLSPAEVGAWITAVDALRTTVTAQYGHNPQTQPNFAAALQELAPRLDQLDEALSLVQPSAGNSHFGRNLHAFSTAVAASIRERQVQLSTSSPPPDAQERADLLANLLARAIALTAVTAEALDPLRETFPFPLLAGLRRAFIRNPAAWTHRIDLRSDAAAKVHETSQGFRVTTVRGRNGGVFANTWIAKP